MRWCKTHIELFIEKSKTDIDRDGSGCFFQTEFSSMHALTDQKYSFHLVTEYKFQGKQKNITCGKPVS